MRDASTLFRVADRARVSLTFSGPAHAALRSALGDYVGYLWGRTVVLQPRAARRLRFGFTLSIDDAGDWVVGVAHALPGGRTPAGTDTARRALASAWAGVMSTPQAQRLRSLLEGGASPDERWALAVAAQEAPCAGPDVAPRLRALALAAAGDLPGFTDVMGDAAGRGTGDTAAERVAAALIGRGRYSSAQARGGGGGERTDARLRFELTDACRRGHIEAISACSLEIAELVPRQIGLDVLLEPLRLLSQPGQVPGPAGQALIERASGLTPARPKMMLRLAEVLTGLGELDAAIRLVRRAREADPRDGAAQRWELRFALWRGDPAEVLPLAAAFCEAQPDKPDGWMAYGAAHLLAGRYAEARPLLEQALARDRSAETLLWWAQLCAHVPEVGDAEHAILEARERHAGPTSYLLAIGYTEEGARAVVRSKTDVAWRESFAGSLVSRQLPAWCGPAVAERALESPEALRALCQDMLERFGGNRTHAFTEVVVGADGNRALRALPNPPTGRSASEETLKTLRYRTPERVLAAFDALLDAFPNSPHPHCYAGELLLWQGKPEAAIRRFNRAIAIQPARWAFVGKSAAFMMLNDPDAARAEQVTCELIYPPVDGATSHIYWGEHYRVTGRLAEAREHLETSVRYKPGRLSGWVNLTLLELAEGNTDAAAACWERVVTLAPGFVWEAAASVGIPCSACTDVGAAVDVAERMLVMMRGNRSSHLITYYAGDEMRVLPSTEAVQRVAVAALVLAAEEVVQASLSAEVSA